MIIVGGVKYPVKIISKPKEIKKGKTSNIEIGIGKIPLTMPYIRKIGKLFQEVDGT
jgi:hypothetical protein